ncbi:MAG TPA: D-mannonate dehydratase [Candidatus Latescibacteria bacterium]|jgi:mannonate dehydratase|nr:D-mannonate dehydratase [Candidatus Latescibacterota bacterium]
MSAKSHIMIEPGAKVAAQMSADPTDQEMTLVRQMGVAYAVTWVDSAKASPEYYRSRREHFERGGIKLYGLGNGSVHNVDAITLNLPNRDEKVEEYKRHIRNLGQADIPYTTYAHMANSVWSTPRETTRGGASARAFDSARLEEASGGGYAGTGLTHERVYTENELWDNFESFIREVAPVAEEAGVRIGIHPDDPPGLVIGGVPRPIFSSFEGYRRAIEIADSPNVGLCLCIGCWLEGGEAMGKGVVDTIRYFGDQGKIFKVHYRNVDQPLPHFVETFVDDGYFDMYEAMKALVEIDYDGAVIPDHIPSMGDDQRLGTVYTISYMRALQRRAIDELAAGSSQ